jgi:hypothetical protein
MAHRIDIELTSQSGESWTWRAAGARQPKGVVHASLLYPGAKVGDVVRAEAERALDGTQIVSVTAPRAARVDDVERIEIQSRGEDGTEIRVQYARDPDRAGRRGDRDRGPRRERADRPERGERGDRPPRGDGENRSRTARPPRADRPERPARPERPERGPRPERPERPETARPRRLTAPRQHRNALLEAVAPEQRPVAEQLLRGGIPAVRQAIIDQNAELRAAGQPEVPAAPLLAMADQLLPRVKQAEWLDRAEAALATSDAITLRDLRAVVAGADGVARDDAAREMAAKLRDTLQQRIDAQRGSWAAEITSSMDGTKLVRAVRLASRLPDANARLDPAVQARLVAETNAALGPDTPADRWLALAEAAAEAPFRRDITPAGLPSKTTPAFIEAAAQVSNRIASIRPLLGISIPPPPRPRAPVAPPAPAPMSPDGAPTEAAHPGSGAAHDESEASVEPAGGTDTA